MKLNFDKDLSKILDYLSFPRMIFNLELEMQEEDETLKEVIKEDFIKLTEKIIPLLEPYKDEINQFYQKDIYSNFDFSTILLKAYSIYDYQDIHDYFDDLLKEDPKTFKDKIIESLITMDSEVDTPKDLNETNATQYINQLKIDSANKWNLFMMIQDSYEYLKKYISFLKKIEPFFESAYQTYEKKIVEVGTNLLKRLSKNTSETFRKLTYDTITYDFQEDVESNLYISFVMPYSLRLIDSEINRIVWGLELEYSFQKIHELKEDKLSQRVKIFKSLGDKTRYEVLRLVAKGVKSTKDIAAELDVSSATISYHLNEFLNSGILYLNKGKNQKFGYMVDYKKLDEVFNELKEDLKFE